MLFRIIPFFVLIGFVACKAKDPQPVPVSKRSSLVPEPDKDLRQQYEAVQKLKGSGSFLADPDTSLSGIQLRDAGSAKAVIGDNNKIDDNDQYHFYGEKEEETLILTQHPGDGRNAISIFEVVYSDKASYGYKQLHIRHFTTEKGITLGISKQQVIDKLGASYIPKDSSANHIELYYRLEQPQDSRTQLLRRHNMPIYYASYHFRNDKLKKMKFGFEYP